MAKKVRTWINILLSGMLGMIGYGCSGFMAEYGTPHAELEVSGQVTNEEEAELENIQIVVVKIGRTFGDNDTLYTNSEGNFDRAYHILIPEDKYKVIANDTAGVYASDSIEQHVTFSGGSGQWNYGSGEMHADFQLKKK